MAQKIQWEPMPALRGKLSKNTQVIYHHNNLTDTDYTRVVKYERNFESKPLTAKEKLARAIFYAAAEKVATTKANPTALAASVAAFNAQTKYKTLHGYMMATEIATIKPNASENSTVQSYLAHIG